MYIQQYRIVIIKEFKFFFFFKKKKKKKKKPNIIFKTCKYLY